MKAVISGALGAMGRVVAANAAAQDIEVIAGVDRFASDELKYPVFEGFANCSVIPDVIIDFSHPSTLPSLLDFAKKNNIPAVIATTGMTENDIAMIKEASKEIPLFFTFNMSLGVNLLCELAKYAAAILGKGFDIEIVEKHHHRKIDAPSGTAIMLANSITEALEYDPELVYERHSKREPRKSTEIGMHAIRGGTIVGEHDVMFCGTDEVITLSHSAGSRAVFATGALKAANFIVKQPAGLYDMKAMIKL